MRVVAGDLKGRRLKSVPGTKTRPTSDKVKEAAFHMMGPFFDGGICLDLFAGSGSLGIEAISRGFDFAIFIDKQKKAIHTILENIELLKIDKKTKVARMDAFKALETIAQKKYLFDLVLIDPPYNQVNYTELINKIINLQLISDNGLIYCEYDVSEKLPMNIDQLHILKKVNYGGTTGITIYQFTS